MTASVIKLATSAEDHHIARMAALALGLTVLEAAIPSPLPGVKPGLANIVILIVLARYGWRAAAWVSLLRVLAGGLLMGSFLSPGFFLGLAGAVCSLAILAASRHLPQRWFGAVSHSILAAFAHIAGQLLLVYFWLIPHAGLAYLLPVFAIAALIFGTVNGLIAARFIQRHTPSSSPLCEHPLRGLPASPNSGGELIALLPCQGEAGRGLSRETN
jgi:heptaprenyl diphosphate synthase